jgi:threonine dehydrogenase-like Zn-dependent dehydrogenase
MIPDGVDCVLQSTNISNNKSLNSTADAGILAGMITCIKKSGTISTTGDYDNTVNNIPIGRMMEKNLNIIVRQSHTKILANVLR